MKAKLIEVKKLLGLVFHYARLQDPQPCYIELDLEDGTLSADYNAEIGRAVPVNVWNRRALRWEIPLMRSTAANRLMEEVLPFAQRVLDGSEIEWDGNCRVGRLDNDAEEASLEIERLCNEAEPDLVIYTAEHWLNGGTEEDLGISADSTDDELEELAETFENEAFDEGIVIEGTLSYLRSRREALREAEGEEEESK